MLPFLGLTFFRLPVEISLFFSFLFSALAVGFSVPMFLWRQRTCSLKETHRPHSYLLPMLAAAPLGADLVASHRPTRTYPEEGRLCNSFQCILDGVTALEPEERLKF